MSGLGKLFIAVGVIVLLFVLPIKEYFLSSEIGNKISDTKDLGVFYHPAKPGKQVVRNKVRDWAYDRSKEDASQSKPQGYNELLGQVKEAGQHANQARRAEALGFAIADGKATSEKTDIRPWSFWTDTMKEVRMRSVVNVGGCMYTVNQRNDPLYECHGPSGWTDAELRARGATKPFRFERIRPDLPYMRVIGRIQKDNCTFGPTFDVGPGTVIDPDKVGYGRLWLGINEINKNTFGHAMTSELGNNSVRKGGDSFSFSFGPA